MKTDTILATVCITVWTAVLALLVVAIYRIPKEPTVQNVIIRDSNTVIVDSYAPIVPEKPVIDCEALIVQVTGFWSKSDAANLANKIRKAANKHNLGTSEAFAIVHIESNFRPRAYNRVGKAYGLCQITAPCLAEYNNHHTNKFELEEMLDPDKNLEVGFWYYSRLLTHYAAYESYGIDLSTEYTALRDAYIAYNFGISLFRKVGECGRNELRCGRYPIDIYGCKKGDVYSPYKRFESIAYIWL